MRPFVFGLIRFWPTNIASAAALTYLGIAYPGKPWLLIGPLLFGSAWLYGHWLGRWLGLNALVSFLLATLAFGLEVLVMSGGVGGALVKALAVSLLTGFGATFGWFHMANEIVRREDEEFEERREA